MIEWEFKGTEYKIIATESIERGDSVWKAIDTVKRADGLTKKFTRRQLSEYFNNK